MLKKKEHVQFYFGGFTYSIYLALKGDIESFHYDCLEMVDGVVDDLKDLKDQWKIKENEK